MRFLYDAWGNPISFHYDELTDEVTLKQTQDCEPILENNKKLSTMNDGYSPSRELKRIASIPLTLAMSWLNEDGISPGNFWAWPKREQNAYFRRRYKSNEFQHLRTS